MIYRVTFERAYGCRITWHVHAPGPAGAIALARGRLWAQLSRLPGGTADIWTLIEVDPASAPETVTAP